MNLSLKNFSTDTPWRRRYVRQQVTPFLCRNDGECLLMGVLRVSAMTALFFFLTILMTGDLCAQQATRQMDRDTLRTGDIFTYHIRLDNVDEFDEVIHPDSAGFGPDFRIRNRSVEPIPGGDSLTYTLQFFGVDREQVPELYAGLRDNADTLFIVIPAASFVYQSRVEDEESALRPLKPIYPFFRDRWLHIILMLIIAAAVGYLIYHYRKRIFTSRTPISADPPPVPEPFLNPVTRLRNELERIEDAYQDPAAQVKSYYTDLGDAFRYYFEETHNFPALESTTGEVIRELEKRTFDEEVIRLTSKILREADLVKFAKFKPNEAQCHDVKNQADILAGRITVTDRQWIEQLRKEHEEAEQQKISVEERNDLG